MIRVRLDTSGTVKGQARLALLAGAFVALLGSDVSGQSSRPQVPFHVAANSNRFQLTAQMEQVSLKSGSPVRVTLRLRNTSSRVLQIVGSTGEYAYELAVSDEAGKAPPMTELGKHLVEDERSGSRQMRDVQPGEEILDTIDITNLFAVNKPGKYFLRLMRVVEPERKALEPEKVVSNAVSFTIMGQ
jgi:hypothetical protein